MTVDELIEELIFYKEEFPGGGSATVFLYSGYDFDSSFEIITDIRNKLIISSSS